MEQKLVNSCSESNPGPLCLHNMKCRAIVYGIILFCISVTSNCAHQSMQFAGIRVVDTQKQPIPSACVYAESWAETECLGFDFSITDEHGATPLHDTFNLPIATNGYITLAAIAQGKSPTVFFRAGRYGNGVMKELILTDSIPGWPSDIGMLAFPYEHNEQLQKKIIRPENRKLLKMLLEIYRPVMKSDGSILPLAQKKRYKIIQPVLDEYDNLVNDQKME